MNGEPKTEELEKEGQEGTGTVPEPDLAAQVQERDQRIAVMERVAGEREAALATAKEAAAGMEKRLSDASKELAQSVAAYKSLIIELNPGMLAELVTGNTVAEVNESLKSARALIERVRQDMEAKVAATKVPAGAPQRSAPDMSGLSAREKIQIAIGGKK